MNPVALITGASRGIGRGIALELARLGYHLVINFAGNRAAADQTAADCRSAAAEQAHTIQAEPCQADIAIPADRERLIEFTRATFHRLDLLVNNAGVAPSVRADLLEATEASFDRLMAVNVKGPFFLTQLAARWMIEQVGNRAAPAPEVGRSNFEGRGPKVEGRSPKVEGRSPKVEGRSPKIVTVSSISAYTASVNRGDYCVSKAALAMLTPLFATRLAEHGIQVFEIRPGIIATDMTGPVREKYDRLIADGLTPIARWGQPADVGRAVAAIAQDRFPFSTGEVLNVDGGFHLRRL
ncbi:MAG: SDR family oxidoreductase [Verrucomicrobiales bacterium]|nr:SDR family oxidoreductase [Verrucomicrobiales bacterium]